MTFFLLDFYKGAIQGAEYRVVLVDIALTFRTSTVTNTRYHVVPYQARYRTFNSVRFGRSLCFYVSFNILIIKKL